MCRLLCIKVNDTRFDSITHEEAVGVLKSTSDRVRLLIGKPAYNAAENEAVLRARRGLLLLTCTPSKCFFGKFNKFW
jgi:hypothetical protein